MQRITSNAYEMKKPIVYKLLNGASLKHLSFLGFASGSKFYKKISNHHPKVQIAFYLNGNYEKTGSVILMGR